MSVRQYFAPGFSSIEEVEERYGGEISDASTLQKIADCPRLYEVRKEFHLERKGPPSAPMVAGIALHAGLDYYYSAVERHDMVEAAAIQVMYAEWDRFDLDRALMDMKYAHLSSDSLAQIMNNYFNHWNYEAIEIYNPMVVGFDDLDLTDVIAAKFRTTSTGQIVLGESNLIMRFDVDGKEFLLAGKPDLPMVKSDGSVWAMDHKSTSSYLSDWWAKSHEVSNKDRGYMAMLRSLLHVTPSGSVINAIYVGEHALNPKSKAAKFNRYQFDFTPGHIDEALRNQQAWNETVKYYRASGYFPQGCGYGGCSMPDVCRRDPDDRAQVFLNDYQPSTRRFWDL